ncbi:MAG: caspase family protein [Deltaproteobacteria bacterium]|nr:MAG: caspase family protein [Deltaproteobacteria bacterium]
MIAWLTALALAGPPEARLAVVVSSNHGLADDQRLLFADDENDRVREALTELGDFEQVFPVKDATPDALTDALGDATVRANTLEQAGFSVTLMVYYTGHAGLDGLHLSGEVLPLGELKRAARVVPADRRLFVVDACQSGQLFRSMGGRLVDVAPEPTQFAPPEGEVWITSAGPEESAFEVDGRRGALFTHFFVSGLRGAADTDGDERVTLGELYGFVARETAGAAAEVGQKQQPRWGGDMTDWVASRVDAVAGVDVDGPLTSPLLVVRKDRARVVAELPRGSGGHLALEPGGYQLLTLGGGNPRVADITVRAGERTHVDAGVNLTRAPRVRTLGGLVETHPWRVRAGIAAATGASPLAGLTPVFALGLERLTGRGHALSLDGFGSRAAVATDGLEGHEASLGGALRWTWKRPVSHGQFGGGATFASRTLRQQTQRAPDGPWGSWYGTDEGAVDVRSADSRLSLGPRISVPLGRAAVDLDLDAGGRLGWSRPTRIQPFLGGSMSVSISL